VAFFVSFLSSAAILTNFFNYQSFFHDFFQDISVVKCLMLNCQAYHWINDDVRYYSCLCKICMQCAFCCCVDVDIVFHCVCVSS